MKGSFRMKGAAKGLFVVINEPSCSNHSNIMNEFLDKFHERPFWKGPTCPSLEREVLMWSFRKAHSLMTKYRFFSRRACPSIPQGSHNMVYQFVSCTSQTLIFWTRSCHPIWRHRHHAEKHWPAKLNKVFTLISLWKMPRVCSCFNPSTIWINRLQITFSGNN